MVLGVQRIGRYEVLSHLASGGMGQVYLARSTGLGGFERQVVVKTLDLSITDDDESFINMFLDEARLVGALHHQYIAPVYEVGCDEQGHYYLVMDYVHGETVETVLRATNERAQPLPLGFALTVGSCVASALDYAHSLCAADGTALEIVHRDVSLSNVMCGHDGGVKLIDFGIAKAANRVTKTQAGTLKGKIGYLAPEQILRGPIDHRADIFALGIVLYELTTGTRAFRDASDLATLQRIMNGEIRTPSEVMPGYPPELERIVMKALQTEPDRRYQDAGTLGRALETFASGRQIPLGHAAIVNVMAKLFGDRRGRRRLARGSEIKTDPTIAALGPGEEEKTPITDVSDTQTFMETIDSETITRAVPVARSQRPTTPIVDPKIVDRKRSSSKQLALSRPPTGPQQPQEGPLVARTPTGPQQPVPLDDLPTSIATPAVELRSRNALIPLEDRPTPIASLGFAQARSAPGGSAQSIDPPIALGLALPLAPPERPTPYAPSERPTPPQRTSGLRTPSTPGLVVNRATVLGTGSARTPRFAMGTDQAPPVVKFRTGTALIAMPDGQAAVRKWLVFCGLFALAVVVAVVVAML
jgi:eukaryotic-like serine/threonine-protein kinase